MFRKLVCLFLSCSLALLFLTALVLLFAPADSAASWTNWSFLWISKARWHKANFALQGLLAVLALVHLALNRQALVGAVKGQGKPLRAFNIWLVPSGLVTLYVFAAAAFSWPPFGGLWEWRAKSAEEYVRVNGAPPYAFAEDTPLEVLSRRLGLEPDKVLDTLSKRSVNVESPLQTLSDIAGKNRLSPAGVYEAARHSTDSPLPDQPGLPAEPPRALGKLKISDVCEQYGLNLAQMLRKLSSAGMKATGDMTLQEIAQSNKIMAIEVYEAMRSPLSGETKVQTSTGQNVPAGAAPQTPVAAAQAPAPAQPAPQSPVQPEAPAAQAPLPQAQDGQAKPTPVTAGAPEGLAKMMLGTYCKEHGIDVASALNKLKAKKITAFGDMSFNEIALENSMSPEDVWNIVVH